MAVTVAKKGDEGKISSALARLMEEDPTLSYENNAETHQQVIGGLGEQHLDVVKAKLKNKFGVEIGLEAPRIAYRESIRKACQKQGRHKKQTGGHGQFGEVIINFDPRPGETRSCLMGGVCGGVAPTDSFFGVVRADPPPRRQRRGYQGWGDGPPPPPTPPLYHWSTIPPPVLGMEPDEDGLQTIIAEVPLAELANFTTFIRQTTQGRGWFTTEFARYEVLPEMLVPAVVEQAKKLGNLDESADD